MGNNICLVLFLTSILLHLIAIFPAHSAANSQKFEKFTSYNDSLNDKIHQFLETNQAQHVFDAEPNAPIPKLFRHTANATKIVSWIPANLKDNSVTNSPSKRVGFGPSNVSPYVIIPSEINELYIYNVSKFKVFLFAYTYNSSELEHYALRVTLTCEDAEFAMPVLAVAKQQRGAVEWQLPLPPPPNTQQLKDYKTVSRTLCPVKSFNYQSHSTANTQITVSSLAGSLSPIQSLSIDVSTQSENPLTFHLITEYVPNFDLKLGVLRTLLASPATPVFLQFNFPDGVDTVLVHATSNYTFCGIVAVQNKTCPVHDLESTVKYSNLYQTMSKQAALTLTKEQFPSGFYVTFLTLSNDFECAGNYMTYDPDRNKIIHVMITEKISSKDFRLGIAVGFLFCTVIYVAVLVKYCHDRRSDARTLSRLGPTPSSSPSPPRRRHRRRTASTTNLVAAEFPPARGDATHSTLGFSSHSSYGAEGEGPSPFSSRLVPSATAERSLQALPTNPLVSAGGGPYTVVQQQGGSGVGGDFSTVTAHQGPATVLLSEERRFDDCAELSRELNESISALQQEHPTLASETVDIDIIHESDSSLNDEPESYSNNELDADSAEGDFGTSGGDSCSRRYGDNQSNFSDSYNASYGEDLETGRPSRIAGGEILNVVQNSGIDTSVGSRQGEAQSSTGRHEQPQTAGAEVEVQDGRRYGASPVLGADKRGCSDGNCSRENSRNQETVFVRDLTRKRARVLRRRSGRYITTLISSFVFYYVPVLQLVSTYQKVLDETGNQDICYYNFLCANPYGLLSDFNHVFSNVGYVMLGLLFAGVTFRRQRRYDKEVTREPHVKQLGIPRDFGLYYAMACALVMEGLLSASYHVCPNRSNFQFDTAFMYVIAILLMLKLYQQRHPDITASADSVFIALALAVLFGVIGGLFGATWFWVVSSIVHVFICNLMSAYVYYLGRWSLIRSMRTMYQNGGLRFLASWIYRQVQSWREWRSLKSHFGTRVALLIIANVSNWAFMLFGLIVRPRDYDTYLLGIFLINLVFYVMFYLIMKKMYSEHLGLSLNLTLLLVVLVWVSAVTVFFQRSTDWSDSPAQSRNLNQPCVILNFFDWHDIWHLLSSLALFTSYCLIMIIDDDLSYTPRDMIAVF